jgi:hypothetical protein
MLNIEPVKLGTTKQMNSKIRIIKKRLSNPRVRRRLKIFVTVWSSLIIIGMTFKFGYDIGYFDAQSLESDQNDEPPITQVLTTASAQRIVSGALKEDPSNPKTVVDQIIHNNHDLSTIVIETDKQKKIAWIIDMRLFFTGDVFNSDGYNLTEGLEQENGIKPADQ